METFKMEGHEMGKHNDEIIALEEWAGKLALYLEANTNVGLSYEWGAMDYLSENLGVYLGLKEQIELSGFRFEDFTFKLVWGAWVVRPSIGFSRLED